VETRDHVLVYDTGPRFGDFDTGWAVLAPYLRSRGRRAVDVLLLSHGSNDHAGGAASLLRELPVRRVLLGGGEAPKGVEAGPCREGLGWNWDGVAFRVLHPPAGYRASENDLSCVLRVEAGQGAALFTGDIEAPAEVRLLASGQALAAGLLQVPHHGSSTSSTAAFVEAVAPRQVVYAVGYRNRFRFPRPRVTERYAAAGAREWRTARDGALLFRLGADGLSGPLAWREEGRRFWHQ
jgi:competence protein ComEC